jgi:predicted amidohydrolase YtcJ
VGYLSDGTIDVVARHAIGLARDGEDRCETGIRNCLTDCGPGIFGSLRQMQFQLPNLARRQANRQTGLPQQRRQGTALPMRFHLGIDCAVPQIAELNGCEARSGISQRGQDALGNPSLRKQKKQRDDHGAVSEVIGLVDTNFSAKPVLTFRMARCILLLVAFAFLLAAQPPDMILVNGKVITVDGRDSIAEAVAIRGTKIVAVGRSATLRQAAGPQTKIIDLRGKAVTPGLIDTHCHFQSASELYDVQLGDPAIKKIADAVALVKARVASTAPGEWVRGRGWDEGKFAEKRYLTAADLDTVSPNNPVYLVQTTGHYGVANSYAMKLAGVTRETQAPPAGTIDRDAKGNPTGVLKESAANLVARKVPGYSREQLRNGLLKIIDTFNKEGMTAVKSASIGQTDWDLYNELLKEDKLSVRVFTLWTGGKTLASARTIRDRILALPRAPQAIDGILMPGGIKFYMDGSGGARTAWMYSDWSKDSTGTDTGNTGYPTTEPEVFSAQVKLLNEAGIHIGTHAIGDRAIDYVVDAYAAALKEHPIKGLRHAIIHANTPTDHALVRMAELQRAYDAGYPEIQPPFLWWLGDNYAGNLGPQRSLRLLPMRTMVKQGVQFGGGSDYFVTPLAARYGLWASVERQPLLGTFGVKPFGTAESIDIHTALKSYTIWAAHQIFMEDRVGSIETGKEADIAVWDRDPYSIPASDLRNMKCLLTLFNGRIVFKAIDMAL